MGAIISCLAFSVMFGGIVSEIELPEDSTSGNFLIKLLPPEDGRMYSSTQYFLAEEDIERVKKESDHLKDFDYAEELSSKDS